MNEVVRQILAGYEIRSMADSLHALREIMQEIALLGFWRSKLFEKAAFYGGTALRVLYGLDRFSEDLDFTLLEKNEGFDLADYGGFLKKELAAFGFVVDIESKAKRPGAAIQSAFLKADTRTQMITVELGQDLVRLVPRNQVLKIKLEIDTDPPLGFSTEMRYLLRPVPFAVRTFSLPDLLPERCTPSSAANGRAGPRDGIGMISSGSRPTTPSSASAISSSECDRQGIGRARPPWPNPISTSCWRAGSIASTSTRFGERWSLSSRAPSLWRSGPKLSSSTSSPG